MIFFYLITFICGSHSLPLQDIGNLLETSIDADVAPKSPDLLSSIKSHPEEFVSEMQQLDPAALKNVITLLENLLAASEARETELIDALSSANTALDAAGVDMAQKEDAKNSADQAVADAQQVAATASTDLENARSHRAAKQTEKDSAQTSHDDEIPALNNEQQVLRDVIAMLNGLPTGSCDAPQQINVIRGSCSSEHNGGYRCEYAYDNQDTIWLSKDGSVGTWIKLEFGGTYNVTGLEIVQANYGYRFKDVSIELSDGETFPLTLDDISASEKSLTLPSPILSSNVKITVESFYTRQHNGFREIRVYGCAV